MSILKGQAATAFRSELRTGIDEGIKADEGGGAGAEGGVPPGGAGDDAVETPPAGAPEAQGEGAETEPEASAEEGAEGQEGAEGEGAPEGEEGAPPAEKPLTPAEIKALREENAGFKKDFQTRVRNEVRGILQAYAEENEHIYRALYNQEPPANHPSRRNRPAPKTAPARPAAGAPQPGQQGQVQLPPDVLERLDRADRFIEDFNQQRENQALFQRASDVAGQYPIFTHEKWGTVAQNLYGKMIRANPRGDLAAMAKEVADQLEAARAADRTGYLTKKKEVARTVPVGAGPAGGPPPGQAPVKRKLGRGKGSTHEATRNDLRALREAEEEEK